MSRLPRSFYARPTLEVARDLLGKRLVHLHLGKPISGIIIETEAYIGEEDDACHARAGRTARTEPLYGPPGFAYVYLNYGLHWLFNCVTEAESSPAGVLIRAVLPDQGLKVIAGRRKGRREKYWADGPGKLSRAFDIDGRFNGADLCDPGSGLYIEPGREFSRDCVTTTPRVGLNKVIEPWKSIPWRFVVESEH